MMLTKVSFQLMTTVMVTWSTKSTSRISPLKCMQLCYFNASKLIDNM